jgi:hypothetical protein
MVEMVGFGPIKIRDGTEHAAAIADDFSPGAGFHKTVVSAIMLDDKDAD